MAAEEAPQNANSKSLAISAVQEDTPELSIDHGPQTRWEKIREVIWDGGYRTKEERKLVQRLDLYVM
jgi:ACS family pantothenate transporter-like MFS transporter